MYAFVAHLKSTFFYLMLDVRGMYSIVVGMVVGDKDFVVVSLGNSVFSVRDVMQDLIHITRCMHNCEQ